MFNTPSLIIKEAIDQNKFYCIILEMKYDFSIILPLYKQDEQLSEIIKDYTSFLISQKITWELILVINADKTNSTHIKKEKFGEIKTYRIKEGGWGRAVKFGISKASGEHICYTNSARTRAKSLQEFFDLARSNKKFIIKANRIVRGETFLRKLGSVIYNLEFRLLFRVPIWDVNGTPKLFPKGVIKKLKIDSNGDLIDAEIMHKTYKNGSWIIEIPIYSNQRRGGKSSTSLKSAFKLYSGLIKMHRKIF
jgi:glycosyltransferase involved in cell wall biosynthesis